MHRHRMFMGLPSLFSVAALTIVNLLDHIFSSIMSVGRAPMPMADFGDARLGIAGAPMTDVSDALYQRGRHEAGVSRFSAARNV